MDNQHKGDPQYEDFIETMRQRKPMSMGLMTSWGWYDDPRRMAFLLSRYKFVAKMLEGCNAVLEIGCGDGFGSRVVAQTVGFLTGVDIEPAFIASAAEQECGRFSVRFMVHDVVAAPLNEHFDAIYSLDVLEHIHPDKEDRFLANMIASLTDQGPCIIGMPSLESQAHASHYSRMGHVNCKEQPAFKKLMQKYFYNVFMFSMNDEIVHTGFSKMSHYNIALCCGKKSPSTGNG
ncbi:MAG: class I SAM-dependent methyltransferase [Bdellovibrionales bacterium]